MTVESRVPAIRVTAMPADCNAYGDIFGGWLVSLMDNAAGLIAARRCRGRAATIAIDGMKFLQPVKVGDEVSVYGEIEKIGRTSMTINIEAWRRERHREQSSMVTHAKFTFVAVDGTGRARPVDE
ncbi:acyl-CoA thioesterase [Novosphingobium pituita]|jgi:acyl-CoA thioesterase YciA|uniref:Acyl-CoA thioesterase n=1 Tax=Novosphingobium pituita TaxID=3056842 RepID=A0ABQ6P3U8_9SPHN|nr:acyl-CoA thioesterase [Novosphingobium sp. IK01]MDK4807257.1 acyl-CoA thioesterase [Novosphingobium aromaticivorans]GMM59461.1 acyl-CoA thioesterase [Novosphingobium sp. IK01]HIQ17336.1 acyl-CoA thioesterase [Novosphingobium capsulatum]